MPIEDHIPPRPQWQTPQEAGCLYRLHHFRQVRASPPLHFQIEIDRRNARLSPWILDCESTYPFCLCEVSSLNHDQGVPSPSPSPFREPYHDDMRPPYELATML